MTALEEYEMLKKKMAEALEKGDLNTRNQFVERVTDLSNSIDWGYRVGETVDIHASNRWERDQILEINGNEFRFKGVVLPHQLIRKAMEKAEQLTFF